MNVRVKMVSQDNVFHVKNKDDGDNVKDCISPLLFPDGLIAVPSKIGYIMITVSHLGFMRKFTIEGSPRRVASSTILISSLGQLKELAVLDKKTEELYRKCLKEDILLKCILRWKKEAMEKYMPDIGSIAFATNGDGTSCFTIRHGVYSEDIVEVLWNKYKILTFASPIVSGGVNLHNKLKDIELDVIGGVDIFIEADEFTLKHVPNGCH